VATDGTRVVGVAGAYDPGWSVQLREAGFFVAPDAVTGLLPRLRNRYGHVEPLGITPQRLANTGAFVPMDLTDELTVHALAWPRTWQILAHLGWPRPKLHSFYVSTKQPGAHALPWHSDVYYPAPGPVPTELFLLMYLHDTTPANGCLRVVPGSHRSDDAVHAARHTQGAASAATRGDEIDVPVSAGDLVVADRRLLHATHRNQTARWRTCLTVAVAPAFDALPEAVQARIVSNPCLPPPGWWTRGDVDARLHPLLPRYDGHAQPISIA
jgi:hypothetical protein